jgi:hypothetical protein
MSWAVTYGWSRRRSGLSGWLRHWGEFDNLSEKRISTNSDAEDFIQNHFSNPDAIRREVDRRESK